MKLFLRVNPLMAKRLVNEILAVNLPEHIGEPTHRCVWVLKYSPVVIAFLKSQDAGCFKVEPDGKSVMLGVSLSEMGMQAAGILADRSGVTRVTLHTRHRLAAPMQKGEFLYSPCIGWCPAVPVLQALSPEEMKFRDLALGIDLYYDYSDSAVVQRNGEKRYQALLSEGRDMGLSEAQMMNIIRKLMS